MKRFKFNLEKLLMIREHKEMEAKLKYVTVLQKKELLETQNRNMQRAILESIVQDYSVVQEGEPLDYKDLSLQEKYIHGLMTNIKNNENLKAELEERLAELKKNYINAKKERKAIDVIKDKRYQLYKKTLKKQEVKEMDEIAGRLIERHKSEES